MYECMYGSTPFAGEDRQNTKIRILNHEAMLQFPSMPPHLEPSSSALDLISRLLVTKEERLCAASYRFNDRRQDSVVNRAYLAVSGSDKRPYCGHFVYDNDAQDVKQHSFFQGIPWSSMQQRQPPFVPQVQGCDDTRYFDVDVTISDIALSEEAGDRCIFDDAVPTHVPSSLEMKDVGQNQHQPEDQHIIPSTTSMLGNIAPSTTMNFSKGGGPETMPPALIPSRIQLDGTTRLDPAVTNICGKEMLNSTTVRLAQTSRKLPEKKRPRDKILRDSACADTAIKLRKSGTFQGYEYRRGMTAREIIDEVLDDQRDAYKVCDKPDQCRVQETDKYS